MSDTPDPIDPPTPTEDLPPNEQGETGDISPRGRNAQMAAILPRPAVNITEQFPDLNPEDNVYLTTRALKVKVKTFHDMDQSEMGNEILHVIGAVVGDDGKVLQLENGKLAVFNLYRRHHILAGRLSSASELSEHIERARLLAVQDTENAWENYSLLHMRALSGVVSLKDYHARKQREGGIMVPLSFPSSPRH
jgi:hypothetical protein